MKRACPLVVLPRFRLLWATQIICRMPRRFRRRGYQPLMFPHTDDVLRALPELIWCGFGMLAMLLAAVCSQPAFFLLSSHWWELLAEPARRLWPGLRQARDFTG